jgi:hypothetical protein
MVKLDQLFQSMSGLPMTWIADVLSIGTGTSVDFTARCGKMVISEVRSFW